MRFLGLDVGTKTLGLALSDPMGMTAQSLTTLRFQQFTETFSPLLKLILENQAHHLIVGLPLNMNGSEGPKALEVRTQMQQFSEYAQKRSSSLQITFWDERLSTVAAERTLLEGDVSRAKRKKVIDQMAAQYILQGYLDSI